MRVERSLELKRGLSINCFHGVMVPEITLGPVEECAGEGNGDSEYRRSYQEICLRIKGIKAEKVP